MRHPPAVCWCAILPLKRTLASIIVCLILPYGVSPIYRFPAPQPFAGSRLWSPYVGGQRKWLRANFHAHGRAWGGLTNGVQSDAEVAAAYRANGYDIAGISDYQRIADASIQTIPVYEHGFNVSKHHQLAIDARYVDWMDFPFWQGVNQKQYIIERLKRSSALVAINHPSRLHSYTVDDLTRLTDYDMIELANSRIVVEERWDAALSSGHAVWAIGGDDTHDVADAARMASAWTMIDAATSSGPDVVGALRAGRSYVVVRTVDQKTAGDLRVADVHVADGTLTISCDGPPVTFGFVGQGGVIRKTVAGATSASYAFARDDTYIRIVVRGPQTDLYLNPVLRADIGDPPRPSALVDGVWTAAYRAAIIAACAMVAWLLF